MKIKLFSFSFFLFCMAVSAQQTTVDSVKTNKLQEVVVTGQINPQSLRKSVHHVRVISKEDIKRLAANNLGDVLNQYINISIRSSGEDGRSQVSMFGLDAQYFKILVDNIPLVSDTGLGTNIDLTQVNLDDIEQIEIIEGSMGVTHGANAVSGILNIITKKSAAYKWEITATVQEETVADEFALFNKGRHIQTAKISHKINDSWFASVGGNRNDFAGFFEDRQGKDYIPNDGKRGYSWLPKEQLAGNAVIDYSKSNFKFFYKFDYFSENVDFYNPIVQPVIHFPFDDTHSSEDSRFISDRFYHHLNANGKLFSQLSFNISASHQKQSRDVENFKYLLEEQQETNNNRQTYQSKEVLYSIGTIGNFFRDDKVDMQVGYEAVNEKGFYDASAGIFRDDMQGEDDVSKRFENYDIFTAAEINFTKKFSVRPGIRYSFQSQFKNQYASSLGLRYLFDNGLELRGSIGESYRTPNFDEMYTYFVDVNHDLQGNPDLIPETSSSYEISIKKNTNFKSGAQLSNTLAVTYLNVDDRISLVLQQVDPTLQYRYMNIDQYQMWNVSLTNQFAYKNWNAKLGAALVGISQRIDMVALDAVSDADYLYALQLNTNVSYNVPKWNTLFSVYYKYNGKEQQYVGVEDVEGNGSFILSELEGYGWMDASVRKTFFRNKFEVTVGARNLLDVQTVRLSQGGGVGGGAHGGSSSNVLLGYGRSYFLKLTYNLNFN